MNRPDTAAPWLASGRDEWLAAVARWIAEQLRIDVGPRSLDVVKIRPWGAVLRARTPSANVIFKALGPHGRHETTLLADIGARQANLAPDIITLDRGRGWILMPDHGEPIATKDYPEQVLLIEQVLAAYAELQRNTADLADRWIADGVPDRNPQRLPTLLEALLAGRGRSGPLPIDSDEISRLGSVVDAFARVCDLLGEASALRGIDHADIHGTNVLLGDASPRLIDWGDSYIGHPFSSVLVPLEWVVGRLRSDERPGAAARLVDAYMEPWGHDGDRVTLGLAVWAGYVARADSNDQQCAGGSPHDIAAAQTEIVALLRTWRDKHPLVDRPAELLVPAMPW